MRKSIFEYTLRYGSLFLFCLFLMVVMCTWLMNQYKDEVIANSSNSMETAADEIKRLMDVQDDLAREIYFNSLTAPRAMKLDELSAKAGINQLAIYQKTLSSNDHLIAIYDDKQFFTHRGRVSQQVFWHVTLDLDEESAALCQSLVSTSVAARVLLHDNNGGRMLFCLYPVPNQYVSTGYKVGFIIREQTMTKAIRALLPESCYALLEMDGQETIRMDRDNIEPGKAQALDSALMAEKNVEKMGYVALHYPIMEGLTLHVAVDTDSIFYSFIAMRRVVFALMLLFTLLISWALWRANMRSVRPIQNLSQIALEHSNHSPAVHGKNELQIVQEIFMQIYQEHRLQDEKDRRKHRDITAQLSSVLLGGVEGNEDMLNALLLSAQPNMKGPYYSVLGIALADESALDQLYADIADRISNVLVLREKQLVLIASMPGNDDMLVQRDLVNQIQQMAGAHKTLIVCGRAYRHLGSVRRSYHEMLSLYELCRYLGQEEGAYFFQKALEENYNILHRDAWLRWQEAFHRRDKAAVLAECQVLMNELESMNPPCVRKYAQYWMIEAIVTNLLVEAPELPVELLLELRNICDVSDKNFSKQFSAIIQEMMQIIAPDRTVADEIVDYIERNYCNPALSLDMLGKQFSMSGSNISKRVKNKTGQTYSDYVSNMRLKQAEELLKFSQLKISDIIHQVGYEDASSFTKKFKATYGKTPNDYREHVQKELNDRKEEQT